MTAHKALVVCVGNSLVGDDAAGCAVYELLAKESLPEGTRLHLLGIGGISLLECLAGEKLLIVVDAVQFGATPGTIHVLNWNDLPQAGGGAVSAHGIGLREAIALGRILSPEVMPQEVLLIGIEGVSFDTIGLGMTQEVESAVEVGAQEVLRQLELRLRD
jgi:hydrogenase maturation protease